MMPGSSAERPVKRRRARVGETVPLTAEQSELLASLYEEYERPLVRYVYSQLGKRGHGGGWTLAEDIAQGVWVELAREGARHPLLSDEPLSADSPRALLFFRAKRAVGTHFRSLSSGEMPVDFTDPVTCNWLCPLMPSGCALVDLPAYLAQMVEALPEQERAALLLMLDGADSCSMAEQLGCSDSTAKRLANAAVLLLQLDNPELSGEAVTLKSLPRWEQFALSELSPARRRGLLGLESTTRQALLLRYQGVDKREIAKRVGLGFDAVSAIVRCAPVSPFARKPKTAPRAKQRTDSKFVQVADALREDIKAMRPGERLPTLRKLAERFGAGCRTITKALAVLRGEGLVESNGVYGYAIARSRKDMEQAA